MNRSKKLGGLLLVVISVLAAGMTAAHAAAPVEQSTSPANGASVQSAPTVSATYDQALYVSSTLVVTDADDAVLMGATSFSLDLLTIVFTPALPLSEGPYTATATVRNISNEETVTVWTFSIDTTAPAVPTISSVDADNATPATGNDSSPTIVVTDIVPGDTVRIFDGSTQVGSVLVPTGATTVTFNAGSATNAPLVAGDGNHSLTATSTDPAGNPSDASAAFVYTLDTSAPGAPTIDSIAGDSTTPAAGNDSTPPIVVSGVIAGDTVSIVDGTTVMDSKVVPALATSVTFNSGTTADFTLTGDVSHSLTATATDPSGNLSAPSAAFVYGLTTSFPGEFHELTPVRILDTRDGTGGFSAPVGPEATIAVPVAGEGGVPLTGASAVVLNVTITQPTGDTFLTVFPSNTTRPLASNLNALPGKSVPNLVVAKLGEDGKVAVYNNVGTSHVIYDVMGWFSDASGANGARYSSLTPARILDTRDGTGGFRGPVGVEGTISVDVTGVGEVPATGVSAVVLNVTATQPTAGESFLTVFPAGGDRPLASNLNFYAGQSVPNLVMAKVNADGKVSVFNNLGTTHVIFDVVGWYSG